MSSARTFVGFGFGAIQAGLFVYEAEQSGVFSRLVVAEVRADIVDAVRRARGIYCVNVADEEGVFSKSVHGIEMLNPRNAGDREQLICAVAEACEIATAVPAVSCYCGDEPDSIISILSEGLRLKMARQGPRAIIYTAENNNQAAEILSSMLDARLGSSWRNVAACLNTVIGKMSGMIADPLEITQMGLPTLTPDIACVCLVEAFNRILVEPPPWEDFEPGIRSFVQKPDLLPFEEAKLFGHNAIHSMLGFLLRRRGCLHISEAGEHPKILELARHAFIYESGAALIRKHAGEDELFTQSGFTDYANDLIQRMLNPHLRDTVARVTRDPRRKLAWKDRLVGAIRLAMGYGIAPEGLGRGMAAAIEVVADEEGISPTDVMPALWPEISDNAQKDKVREFVGKYLEQTM